MVAFDRDEFKIKDCLLLLLWPTTRTLTKRGPNVVGLLRWRPHCDQVTPYRTSILLAHTYYITLCRCVNDALWTNLNDLTRQEMTNYCCLPFLQHGKKKSGVNVVRLITPVAFE